MKWSSLQLFYCKLNFLFEKSYGILEEESIIYEAGVTLASSFEVSGNIGILLEFHYLSRRIVQVGLNIFKSLS